MPCSMSRSVNAIEVYWDPASVWWTSPVRSVTPSVQRVHMPISRQSSTRSVRIDVAARQPRMRREKTSNTNAT